MSQPLSLEKEKIHALIIKNPGLYLTKIAEMLGMSVNLVDQHLKEMEHNNIVFSTEEDGFKRYYIDERRDGEYKKIILGIRKKIFGLIAENPGLSLTKIAETLGMGISLARYHLNYLEKNENIIAIKEEGYKRYYIKSSEMAISERKLLSLLRQELPLKIVYLLIENKTMQHKQLLENFDIAPSTLTYHLNKLLRDGVIELQTYGKEKGYAVKNKKAIIEFLRRYRIHKMVEDFKDIWGSINLKY